MNKWEPIETAPKDGKPFLAAPTNKNASVFVAIWLESEHPDVDKAGWYDHWNFDPVEFTHWMPLPHKPGYFA